MRITVGGLLLLGVVGAGVGYLATQASSSGGVSQMVNLGFIKDEVKSLVSLFKSGGEKEPVIYAPPPPFPDGTANQATASTGSLSLSVGTVPVQDAKTVPVEAEVPANLPAEPAAAVAPVQKESPFIRSKPGRRVKYRIKKTYEKKKSAVDSGAAALTGKMVSLELTSGRIVQGVLQGKTASEYKVELPGLGIFSYPIQNVKNIRKAAN